MKKWLLFLFSSVVIFNCFGQISMIPPPKIPTHIPQPDFPMYDHMMFFPSEPVLYDCNLYLSDSTTVVGESGIYKNNDGIYYINIEKQKYMPGDTDSVYVNKFWGLPKGDHWLFKTASGNVNIYCKYPTISLNKNSFLSKIEDQFIPFSSANLKLEIEDNPEALSMYNSVTNYNLMGGVMTFGGLGVVLISFLSLPKDGVGEKDLSDFPQTNFMIGGAISVAVGSIIIMSKKITYNDVVKIYNEY
jgi:hypothetical protein